MSKELLAKQTKQIEKRAVLDYTATEINEMLGTMDGIQEELERISLLQNFVDIVNSPEELPSYVEENDKAIVLESFSVSGDAAKQNYIGPVPSLYTAKAVGDQFKLQYSKNFTKNLVLGDNKKGGSNPNYNFMNGRILYRANETGTYASFTEQCTDGEETLATVLGMPSTKFVLGYNKDYREGDDRNIVNIGFKNWFNNKDGRLSQNDIDNRLGKIFETDGHHAALFGNIDENYELSVNGKVNVVDLVINGKSFNDNFVTKEEGKGLSTEDFTTEFRKNLINLEKLKIECLYGEHWDRIDLKLNNIEFAGVGASAGMDPYISIGNIERDLRLHGTSIYMGETKIEPFTQEEKNKLADLTEREGVHWYGSDDIYHLLSSDYNGFYSGDMQELTDSALVDLEFLQLVHDEAKEIALLSDEFGSDYSYMKLLNTDGKKNENGSAAAAENSDWSREYLYINTYYNLNATILFVVSGPNITIDIISEVKDYDNFEIFRNRISFIKNSIQEIKAGSTTIEKIMLSTTPTAARPNNLKDGRIVLRSNDGAAKRMASGIQHSVSSADDEEVLFLVNDRKLTADATQEYRVGFLFGRAEPTEKIDWTTITDADTFMHIKDGQIAFGKKINDKQRLDYDIDAENKTFRALEITEDDEKLAEKYAFKEHSHSDYATKEDLENFENYDDTDIRLLINEKASTNYVDSEVGSLQVSINKCNSEIEALNNSKVDKEDGKGLSTNDFTTEYKTKLDGLSNYNDSAIQTSVSTNTSEIESLKTEIASLKAQIAELKDAMGDVAAVLDTLNGEVNTMLDEIIGEEVE